MTINAEGVREIQPRATPWDRTVMRGSNSERVRNRMARQVGVYSN